MVENKKSIIFLYNLTNSLYNIGVKKGVWLYEKTTERKIINNNYSFLEKHPIIPNLSIYNAINLLSTFYRNVEAIDCLDLTVSYDEMIKDAITMSKALKELGIKKGDIISVSMPNYYQGVITFLAANRIGAITTFINSMSSIEEVLRYLNEFESTLFINYDKDEEYNK